VWKLFLRVNDLAAVVLQYSLKKIADKKFHSMQVLAMDQKDVS